MDSNNNQKYWHTKFGFINPKGSHHIEGIYSNAVRWVLNRALTPPYKLGVDVPSDHVLSRDKALSSLAKHKGIPSITWLGHATFLIRINGISILTDPLLFGNPGPSWVRALKRLPNPLQSEDLGKINVLLLSHKHGDHVHLPSLRSLKQKTDIQPVVSLGVTKKVKKCSFKKSVELDWFDDYKINDDVKITAVPALHYSNMINSTLWAGFVITFKDGFYAERKIYFSGDTGYGPFMKRDIAPYGPFDIACIGLGSFCLNFPTGADLVHTNPEEAIQAAKDIDAKKIIGMHWGTVKQADENPRELEPRMRTHAEKIKYIGNITMLRIGETIPI